MKTLTLVVALFFLSACGGPTPVPPSTAPVTTPAETPVAAAVDTTPAAPAVPAWSDLETLEETMESNGDAMKALRAAAQRGNVVGAAEPAATLLRNLSELDAQAAGFAGDSPAQFRSFASQARAAAEQVVAVGATDSPAATKPALDQAVANLRAACKQCHDVYHKE